MSQFRITMKKEQEETLNDMGLVLEEMQQAYLQFQNTPGDAILLLNKLAGRMRDLHDDYHLYLDSMLDTAEFKA